MWSRLVLEDPIVCGGITQKTVFTYKVWGILFKTLQAPQVIKSYPNGNLFPLNNAITEQVCYIFLENIPRQRHNQKWF